MIESMGSSGFAALLIVALAGPTILATPSPDVDTRYPYTGAAVPFGDILDPTINGNGKGLVRLSEPPAVSPPLGVHPTNNINVISMGYVPTGMNIHFQTPFGIGGDPVVHWGMDKTLGQSSTGVTTSYDRTPPCSLVTAITQCSQYFHDVQITNLQPGTTYYYQVPGGNGTTPSDLMSFTTARPTSDKSEFSVAVLNDMGYTFAAGTWQTLVSAAADDNTAFVWHGGDISYADDWVYALQPCDAFNASLAPQYVPRCYNGSGSTLPYNIIDDPNYYIPVPAGEGPTQGGPQGGDMATIYETNWDLWQNWMNPITKKLVYMVLPGNHEAACTESDWGVENQVTAILDDGLTAGSSAPVSNLSYWSCPPSQRNFTAYQYRFRMPGSDDGGSGGVTNFWYSFDYGLAHFISFDSETDYPFSGEYPFVADLSPNETLADLQWNDTWVTNSGPFGEINGNWTENESYQQWHWLKNDLANVDRSKTPWVFAMAHRPMYSSQVSPYQEDMRNAWEEMFIQGGVDLYTAGHIHWYERMWPLGRNGTIDNSSVLDDHTYQVNPGKSMIHMTNGQAGNIESHSILGGNPIANTTAYLDFLNYGSSRLTVHNETHSSWQFIRGGNQTVGDYLYIVKPPSSSNSKRSSSWDRLKKTAKRFVTESSKTRDLGSL